VVENEEGKIETKEGKLRLHAKSKSFNFKFSTTPIPQITPKRSR
jgi:hypothetical protein